MKRYNCLSRHTLFLLACLSKYLGYCLCTCCQLTTTVWSLLRIHGMLHVLHFRKCQGYYHRTNRNHGHHDGRCIQRGRSKYLWFLLCCLTGFHFWNNHFDFRTYLWVLSLTTQEKTNDFQVLPISTRKLGTIKTF